MKSAVRISLNRVLIPELRKLKGTILDVGSGRECIYHKYIIKTKDIYTMDIDKATEPDYCCPIEKMKVGNDRFDGVIATEVLEHSSEPQRAINEINRVLKKGGKCILTTRFMYPFHQNPHDYFRFSKEGLEHLFRGFSKVEIIPQGNRIMLLWEMINPNYYTRAILNMFNWFIALFDFKDKKFSMGFLVVATK